MVSCTVTVKLHVLWLAALSIAVQVSVVVPREKVEPEGGLQPIEVTAQLSVAVALKETAAPFSPVHSAVWLAGQVMVGGCWSTTVTVAVQEAEAPLLSVTVRVTGVVPKPYGPGGV